MQLLHHQRTMQPEQPKVSAAARHLHDHRGHFGLHESHREAMRQQRHMQGGSLHRLGGRRRKRKHRQLLQLRHVQHERGGLCSLTHGAAACNRRRFAAANA
ncbi:hypothetical protein CCH79_00007506, partial [Gambusia affinis]